MASPQTNPSIHRPLFTQVQEHPLSGKRSKEGPASLPSLVRKQLSVPQPTPSIKLSDRLWKYLQEGFHRFARSISALFQRVVQCFNKRPPEEIEMMPLKSRISKVTASSIPKAIPQEPAKMPAPSPSLPTVTPPIPTPPDVPLPMVSAPSLPPEPPKAPLPPVEPLLPKQPVVPPAAPTIPVISHPIAPVAFSVASTPPFRAVPLQVKPPTVEKVSWLASLFSVLSSRSPSIKGISNVGNSCYRNAAYQALRGLPFFREKLNQPLRPPVPPIFGEKLATYRKDVAEYKNGEEIRKRLLNFIEILEEAERGGSVSGRDLVKAEKELSDFIFRSTSIVQGAFSQQDGADYARLFFEALRIEIPYEHVRSARVGETLETDVRKDVYAFLNVPRAPGIKNIQGLIAAVAREEVNDYWRKHPAHTVETRLLVDSTTGKPAEMLALQLVKTAPDNPSIEFPENGVIDLSRLYRCPAKYKIASIMMRIGKLSAYSGHYTSYVRKGEQWFYCDDSTVTPVERSRVEEARKEAHVLFLERIPEENEISTAPTSTLEAPKGIAEKVDRWKRELVEEAHQSTIREPKFVRAKYIEKLMGSKVWALNTDDPIDQWICFEGLDFEKGEEVIRYKKPPLFDLTKVVEAMGRENAYLILCRAYQAAYETYHGSRHEGLKIIQEWLGEQMAILASTHYACDPLPDFRTTIFRKRPA